MHIALLTNLYPPDVLGGYELLAADIAHHLRAAGHRLSVLTTGNARENEPDVSRSLRLLRSFSLPPRRNRLVRPWVDTHNARAASAFIAARGKPDAVLVLSQRRLGLGAFYEFQRQGVPSVITVNDDWPAFYTPSKKALLGWVDRVVTPEATLEHAHVDHVVWLSQTIRKRVRDDGVHWPDGVVRAQGVDLSTWRAREHRELGKPVRLVFTGRLHPSKAPDVVIDAAIELHRREIPVRLDLIGAPVDAAYGEELASRIRAAGAGSYIHMRGAIPRQALGDAYREADICLFVNRWNGEAMGLTYLEAMACGVPVVAHPRGGAAELLEGTEAYEHADACDGEAVAEAVERIVSDPARLLQRRAAGLALVRERATLTSYVQTLESELSAAAREARRS